ncbi:MAG: pentapeptide repeat-containing protein [Cyanobacteria bacterium P01_G01_bin.54]
MGQDYPRYEVIISEIATVVVTNSEPVQELDKPDQEQEKSNFNVVVNSPKPKSFLFKWFSQLTIGKLYSDFVSLNGIQLLAVLVVILIPVVLFYSVKAMNQQSALNNADGNHHQMLKSHTDWVDQTLASSETFAPSPYEKYNQIRTKTQPILKELSGDPQRKAHLAMFLHEAGVTDIQEIEATCHSAASQRVIPSQNCTERLLDFYLGGDLKYAEFEGWSFYGATFRNADLRHANFRKTNLEGVNFEQADLRNANFTQATVTCEQLHQARFTTGVILDDALHAECNLPGSLVAATAQDKLRFEWF